MLADLIPGLSRGLLERLHSGCAGTLRIIVLKRGAARPDTVG